MHTELFVIRMIKMLVISISVTKNTLDASVKENKKEKNCRKIGKDHRKYFG